MRNPTRLAIGLSLAAAVACGQSSPVSPTGTPTPVTTPTPTPTPDPAPTPSEPIAIDFQLSLSRPESSAAAGTYEPGPVTQSVETRAQGVVSVSGGDATVVGACMLQAPEQDAVAIASLTFEEAVTPAMPFSFDRVIALDGFPFPTPASPGAIVCHLTGRDTDGEIVELSRDVPITPAVLREHRTVCQPDDRTVCAHDRFQLRVEWRDVSGQSGPARVDDRGRFADGGFFYFFDPDSFDMLVQVIDNCSADAHYWVYLGATSGVEVTLTVIDTLTGLRREYFSPLGEDAEPYQDEDAFATCP